MTKTTHMAASLALLIVSHGALACDYPERVKDFPDGNTATQEEMLAAQKLVKAYVTSMEAYLDCIKGDEAQALIALGDTDEEAKRQRALTFDKKHNAAVEEMNLVAEEFNVQVRAFKERNK